MNFRMIRGRRKIIGFVHDEWTEWLNDLEAGGATLDELDDAFAHVEVLGQYDKGRAILHMSAHERAIACGRVDTEARLKIRTNARTTSPVNFAALSEPRE